MTLKKLVFILLVTFVTSLKFSFASQDVTKTFTVKVDTPYGELITQIHSSDAHKSFVKRVASILENDTRELIEYFDWVPDADIHIVINSSSNSSNGFATVFPRLKIELNDYPPLGTSYLNSSGDWLKNLVLHELTHIIHMSQARGAIKLVDTIFGSIGRGMTGIVPRWFTEGIAVWAETKFTSAGRLRDEMMIYEARRTFVTKGYCQNLDCLSVPGSYPHGHAPYWLGGMFIDYIEKNNPGAIACIIKSNSRKIPFSLSSAFSECLNGTGLGFTFHSWRNYMLAEIYADKKIMENFHLKYIDLSERTPSWYMGSALVGNNLYFIENKNFINEIAIFDFETDKVSKYRTLGPIDAIYSFQNDKTSITLAERPFLSDEPTRWSTYNTKNEQETILKTKKSYLYYLKSESADYGFSYASAGWSLEKLVNGRVVYKRGFPSNYQIYSPFIDSKNKLNFITFNDRNEVGSYWRVGKKARKNFSDNRELRLLDHCGDWPVLKRRDGAIQYYDGKNLKVFKTPLAKEIVNMKLNKKRVALWLKKDTQKIFYIEKNCKSWLKSQKTKKVSSPIKKLKKQKITILDEKKYHLLPHLYPHHWLLMYLGGSNTYYISAQTTLSDPTEKLQLNLSANSYHEISKFGGNFGFTYDLGSSWSIGSIYNKSFAVSSIDGGIENQDSYGASIGKTLSFSRINYGVFLSGTESKVNDFISDKKLSQISITQSLNLVRVFSDDFLNKVNLSAEVFEQHTEGFDKFIGQNYFLNMGFVISNRLSSRLEFSYGKMDKRGLLAGAISAGERDSHKFLGLETGSAFSNEISIARFEFEFKMMTRYRSLAGLPILVKDIRLILGTEWLKSDFIFLGDSFYNNEDINSYHIGLRIKAHAFYYVPTNIDIFYSVAKSPDGKNYNKIFFDTGLFFF